MTATTLGIETKWYPQEVFHVTSATLILAAGIAATVATAFSPVLQREWTAVAISVGTSELVGGIYLLTTVAYFKAKRDREPSL